MEIIKIMRNVKQQQNFDRYSSFSLPFFSNSVSLQTHRIFATNPLNPQPVNLLKPTGYVMHQNIQQF